MQSEYQKSGIVLLNNDEWLKKKKGKPFMDQNQEKKFLVNLKVFQKLLFKLK